MKKLVWGSVCCLIAYLLGSCVEPYTPPEIPVQNGYLVVGGFLNGNGPTVFKLTRTQDLTATDAPAAETRARVLIEGERGNSFSLSETVAGTYTLSNTTIPANQSYRLRINTAGGDEYLSDFVPLKETPKIDQLNWAADDEGLQILLTTGDPTGNSRFYRWEFEETWEFVTPYNIVFEYKAPVLTPYIGNTSRCWRTEKSGSILLGTSARLGQDLISQYPLRFLDKTSERHRIKYSILVRQYALTEEEYNFWQNLKKNTESLGTLFDPQPSQLQSNIRSVRDPAALVIGFFGAYSVETQRLFVTREELPDWTRTTGYESCQADTILRAELGLFPQFFGIGEIYPTALLTSAPDCMDCRLRGTNVMPDFWE